MRASHIKPWARCQSDAERLNVYNGLLLAVHLDAAFDRGFITFDEQGRLVVSERLKEEDARILGLKEGQALRRLEPAHRQALAWHHEHCFK